MIFSSVKSITIPEGKVVKILLGNVVLWQSLLIPEEYQQVEYIQSTGTQYIDTGIVPSNHMVEVKYDSETYNNDEHVFGTTANALYFHFTLYGNKYYWGLSGKEASGGAWSTGVKTLLYNYGDNHEVILDGVTLGSGSNISSTKNLTLCRRVNTNFKGKYYYFKVTDRSTGLLVRNMIPCYRKADGEVGMYDIVSKQFFVNSGTGEFSYGSGIVVSDDGNGNITWVSPDPSVSDDGAGNVTFGNTAIVATDDGAGNITLKIGG